jgi:splicing suppressor protein 51
LGLDNTAFLHKLAEKEVFAQLIDCFRMRVEDEYAYGCNNIGIYAGEDPRPAFRGFLDLAEKREGILPGWWNVEKRKECERVAVDEEGWNDINCAVEKNDIMEHYGDNLMPMKLRILGEKVYGKGFM